MTDRDPLEQMAEQFSELVRAGEAPSIEHFAAQHPELASEIRELFPVIMQFEQAKSGFGANQEGVAANADAAPPPFLGRYQVKRLLGAGGFGKVYLGWDDQLQREVAIKLPHAQSQQANDEAFETLVREAKLAAAIDHPGIVPVYDIGRTNDDECYFVSRYIDGESLADLLRRRRPNLSETIEIIRQVADALDGAHRAGLVHRDIKPANLLIDEKNRVYITDFGIALFNSESSRQLRNAGTPRYMSPEQAQSERRTLDARSDVYSLGVVFYELLTGTTPFASDSTRRLLEKIGREEASPPRQLNPRIPVAIEQICLRCIARRRSSRYQSAGAVAKDLRDYLGRKAQRGHDALRGAEQTAIAHSLAPPGNRAYSRTDSHAFLWLVPGPYDAHGIPESVHTWKHRIESEGDDLSDTSMRVGILYGDSGVGKSSFMEAGVLPQLSPKLVPVVIVAARTQCLATQVHAALTDRFATSPVSSDPFEILENLKKTAIKSGRKQVIVIDQMERFVDRCRANPTEWRSLDRLLEHCDGQNVMAVLVVSTYAWLPLRHRIREGGIETTPNVNSFRYDRFDQRHAKRVLRQLGLATNCINDTDESAPQIATTLDLIGTELADDGRISASMLAHFHAAAKDVSWTPKTVGPNRLAKLGQLYLRGLFGASDSVGHAVGRESLEVLAYLVGSDESESRSFDWLQAATGLDAERLQQTLDILESDFHLIEQRSTLDAESDDEARYRLSARCLVRWIVDKPAVQSPQADRARRLLRLRCRTWQRRRLPWKLPSFWEYLRIRYHVPNESWSDAEAEMMRLSRHLFVVRGQILLALGVITTIVVCGIRLFFA